MTDSNDTHGIRGFREVVRGEREEALDLRVKTPRMRYPQGFIGQREGGPRIDKCHSVGDDEYREPRWLRGTR